MNTAHIRRTCCHCGGEFTLAAGQRHVKCSTCRAPKRHYPAGSELTPREFQVAQLVGQGKRNKEIANALLLSEGTIKEYVWRIFIKLKLASRIELALWAKERA